MNWLVKENGFVHICGHRGHSLGAPENTLAALEAARQSGATTCEIDLVLTKDEDIVVLHDLTLDRTSNGKGLVKHFNLADIQSLDAGSFFHPDFAGEKIPSLKEVLEYARGKLGLVIEIKERFNPERLIARLAQLLDETQTIDDVIIISFDHPSLLQVKDAIPGIKTEGILHARHVDPVSIVSKAKLDSVSIELDMFHPDDARALHENGTAIRVHLPQPAKIQHFEQYGIGIEKQVKGWLAEGLIDSISGDDVTYLKDLVTSV